MLFPESPSSEGFFQFFKGTVGNMDSSREQQCHEYRTHDTAWELLKISMLLEKGTTPELCLFKCCQYASVWS